MNYEQYSKLQPQGQRDALIKLQFETHEVLNDILSILKSKLPVTSYVDGGYELASTIQKSVPEQKALDGVDKRTKVGIDDKPKQPKRKAKRRISRK